MDNVNPSKKHCVREEKCKQIALKSDLIRVSDYHYHVHSQTTNRNYGVIKEPLIQNAKFSSSDDMKTKGGG